jgi:hypothetical protein
MPPMQPPSTVHPPAAEVGAGEVESTKLGGEISKSTKVVWHSLPKAATEVAKNAAGTYPLLGGEHLLKSQSVTPPLSPCRTLMHLTTKLQVVFVAGP